MSIVKNIVYVVAAIALIALVVFGAFAVVPSVDNGVGISAVPLVAEAFGTGAGGGCCGGGDIGGAEGGGEFIGDPFLQPPQAPPVCALNANPGSIGSGQNATLTWTSHNTTSAVFNHGIGAVSVNGSRNVSPSTTTTYTLTVSGPGGTTTCSAPVTVTTVTPAPNCTLNINPSSVAHNGSATITWSSNNATTATIDHGIGSVNTNGSRSVSGLTATRTYTMTVSGSGGTATCSDTVTVSSQPTTPSCTLHANPTSIHEGNSSTLTWTSNNATSASLSQGIGNVSTNGSYTVNPSSTRTYVLTVTGSGGTATCSETIGVLPVEPPRHRTPSCSLSVNYDGGYGDNRAVLSWFTSNAYSAWINNGVGSVSLSGTRSVPTYVGNRTYVMTVEGVYGERATCYATVNRPYIPPPPPPVYQPPVYQPPIAVPQPTISYRTVSVAQVPYTGPEDALYVFSMLLVALGAGAGIWLNRERFFGERLATAGVLYDEQAAIDSVEITEDEVAKVTEVEEADLPAGDLTASDVAQAGSAQAGDSLTLEKTDEGPKLNFRRRI